MRTSTRVHEEVVLPERYGVRVRVEGSSAPSVVLRFDGIGIGRVASRTIALDRGRIRAGITVSSYGRARAW